MHMENLCNISTMIILGLGHIFIVFHGYLEGLGQLNAHHGVLQSQDPMGEHSPQLSLPRNPRAAGASWGIPLGFQDSKKQWIHMGDLKP